MIIHCMQEKSWNKVKNKESFSKKDVRKFGFIHCSTVEYFWRVAPNFKGVKEPPVLICIDENKLLSEVKYEDSDGTADIILTFTAKSTRIQSLLFCRLTKTSTAITLKTLNLTALRKCSRDSRLGCPK